MPAIVIITPVDTVTLRTRWFPVSVMYILPILQKKLSQKLLYICKTNVIPDESIPTLCGLFNAADVA